MTDHAHEAAVIRAFLSRPERWTVEFVPSVRGYRLTLDGSIVIDPTHARALGVVK